MRQPLSKTANPKAWPRARRTFSRTGHNALPTAAWPTIEEWTRRQQELATMTFRRLGIGAQRMADNKLWVSQVLNVLGPDSFAAFAAVRTPGQVIWCNFDLIRQLGFEVPPSNQLTPEFHQQLLAALSFRAVGAGENVRREETVTMYADRYGGDGVRPALGAGRAGFLPFGNLYLKGVGFTPLFKHDDEDDFAHSHGAVHLDDCLREAVFGEVNENLFAHGATRVVAIIDHGQYVTAPSGQQFPVALVVRTGAQLRPGHLLGSRVGRNAARLDKFVQIARATGQLVTHPEKETGRPVPDVKATMLRIIDDHARTAAEGFRWRMIHGALSASNMEMSGAMLDLPTQSAQPRTAPIWSLDYADSVFGSEHISRAARLATVYRSLMRHTPQPARHVFNVKWLNVARAMNTAYNKHLAVQLLCAVGLKTEVAQRMQTEQPALSQRFTDLILQMVALQNPGTRCVSRSVVERVSVLDVFNLLKNFPRKYFAHPQADHTAWIRKYLKPVFSGNRFHVAKKQALVGSLISKLAGLYGELLTACANYAHEYYGDQQRMQASITTRAAFENEPLTALYAKLLYEETNKAIAAYRSNGNTELVRAAIDQRIATSLRSVDALLAQGDARRLRGGGVELEMRTIAGINYSVRAWNDAQQTRRLRISIPVERNGHHYLSVVPHLPPLSKRQIQLLRYRFTIDGWKTSQEARAHLLHDEREGHIIEFAHPCTFPLVGRLEGAFYVRESSNLGLRAGTPYFRGYVFAIPDKQELLRMVAGPACA